MQRLLGLGALLAAVAGACGGSDVSSGPDASVLTCTNDDQCPVGQSCVGGICAVPLDAGPTPDATPLPPEIVVTPTVLDFGSALLGTEVTLTVEIANIGGSPLHVTNLELRETDALPEYNGTPLGPVNITVDPAGTTTVSVTLTQADDEIDMGELRISSDDDDEPLVIVGLISDLKGTPQLSAAPTVIDYGVVDWGTMPSADVDVQNVGTGNSPLVITAASVTNTSGMGGVYAVETFSVDPVSGAETAVTLPQYLAAADMVTPADTLRVRVTFDTTTVGAGPIPDEDLVLLSNDADPADMQKHVPIEGNVLGCAAPDTEVCDNIDNDCDLQVDEDDAGGGGGCFTGIPGACANGTYHCLAGGVLTCVDNGGPSPEVCDNLDNDCDGATDEALVQSCSTACGMGVEFCVTGSWLGCNAPAPQPEDCDGVDNDCDGATDEGDPGSGAACVTMQPGVCNPGTLHCLGGGLSCVRNIDPSPEVCDGADNDCDATTDEGDPGAGAACTSASQGICQPGTEHCVAGGIACVSDLAPTAETCNGLDDDCNGVADNGDPGSGGACSSSGLGVCQPGTAHCVSGGIACVSNLSPSPESCNGLDDNCDGMSDEGDPGGGAGCATGLPGVCSTGVNHCQAGLVQCVPNTSPGTVTETCDGLDNDCDSSTDEGNPGGGAACSTGELGVCNPGTMQCLGGLLICVHNTAGSAESCDGLDNDCDGTVDEGFGLGNACDGSDTDLCTEGVFVCSGGVAVCNDANDADPDVCNGVNDDCNAATADGADDPMLGVACDGSDTDLCTEGVRVCTAGTLTCNDANDADPDVCNGMNDDCNGATADGSGDPLLGTTCDGTDADLCAEGTRVCTAGALECTDSNDLDPDVCNGVDDDCNPGTSDGSGDPLLGASCDGTDADLCNEGTRFCTAGALACNDPNDADPDVCNGADDDCNVATVDGSGDPLLGTVCDGTDADLCNEGTRSCVAGALACSDANDADPDVCNGTDDDCNPGTPDGAGDPLLGTACDGTDTDLCNEGTRLCTAGALACTDPNDADPDVCNGTDDDCNPATVDGVGDPLLGTVCDGSDADLCNEGTRICTAGALACTDPNDADPDVCNAMDDDCNPGTSDGSGDPLLGTSCDGGDTDLCNEGSRSCSGGTLVCSDTTGNNGDVCNGADDDCNSATADGATDPLNGTACDGTDADLCDEGTRSCSAGTMVCSDPNDADPDICNGANDDCNAATADGSQDPLLGTACDGADADFCTEGTRVCTAGALACNDPNDVDTEVCNGIDDDCNGTTDQNAYYTDGVSTTCAGAATVNVAPGAQVDVSGVVDPTGDDYFTVNFTSVPGAGYYYHPKVELIGGTTEYLFTVETSCGAGALCASTLTAWEMLFPSNPNNCLTYGNCSDASTRITQVVVHVQRIVSSPTTCTTWTVRSNNL